MVLVWSLVWFGNLVVKLRSLTDLVESTETLVVDVYIAVELRGRITEVKDEHCLVPETPEELAGPQGAYDTWRSPEIGYKDKTRLTSLQPGLQKI